MDADRSRLSHHVTRMEKRDLVTREEGATDGRAAMIRITPAGRTAIERAAPGHVAATRQHFFDHITDDEIDTLTDVFDRILRHLDGPSS